MARSTHTYGFEEVRKMIKRLPDAVDRVQVNRASREAMRPVRRDARSLVSVDSGTLKKAIKILTLKRIARRVYRFPEGGVVVGADYEQAPHAHLVEYGTGTRYRRMSSKGLGRLKAASTGAMPAQPFMRPAYERNRNDAFRIFAREYGPVLQKEIDKIVRQEAAK